VSWHEQWQQQQQQNNSRRQQIATVAATAVAEVAFKTKHILGIRSFNITPIFYISHFLY
jgi:hypothetical protein